jgi:multidrug efflux system outer membrane protein
MSAWELDFFGRVASLKDVALAQYLASEEARKSPQTSLIAAWPAPGCSLQTDDRAAGLTERTLGTREESLRLTKLRFDNGASSALDCARPNR